MVLGLARALMSTSGRAVAVRAVPLLMGVGLVAAIVFGGHGVPASLVVKMMHASLGVRLSMFVAWTVAAAPAAMRAFDAPGTITLRSLRPPRAPLFAILVVIVCAAQAPWIALASSTGFASGAVAAFVACAATTSLPGFASALALVAIDPPSAIAIGPAFVLAIFSVRHAWRHALEQRAAVPIVRRAPPAIALAMTYVARILRVGRARLNAAAMLVFAGEGALALSLRNDPDARPIARALSVLAFPLAIAAALLAAPAVETEARLRPLLRSTRTKTRAVALAMILALATPSSALAATASVAFAPSVTLVSVGYALVIASAVAVWARRAARARRSSTFILGVAVIATAFTIAGAAC
ncbi:MAG TPA: hypothetical protein VGH87_17745 [Polyangiaceae bacterium]|jgi:hypothetical protein